MAITYLVHEAKARFSEVIRLVRSGSTVTMSCRGEPVAGIRSIRRESREDWGKEAKGRFAP